MRFIRIHDKKINELNWEVKMKHAHFAPSVLWNQLTVWWHKVVVSTKTSEPQMSKLKCIHTNHSKAWTQFYRNDWVKIIDSVFLLIFGWCVTILKSTFWIQWNELCACIFEMYGSEVDEPYIKYKLLHNIF